MLLSLSLKIILYMHNLPQRDFKFYYSLDTYEVSKVYELILSRDKRNKSYYLYNTKHHTINILDKCNYVKLLEAEYE